MNYTIIGYTADGSYHDRCGDYISKPGEFETQFFRDEDKHAFLWAWANAKFHSRYEDLIILLNGIPNDRLEDEEYEQYEDIEREMETMLPVIKAKHDENERIRREAAAEAALQKARQIAEQERARDLAQLEALQRKLGVR